ncbi:MAG: TfuA-like protein [Pyrinomonadaceae bacterium]
MSETVSDCFLFAGPSLHCATAGGVSTGGARVLPPVRRGDVERLVAARTTPGTIVIADGLFEQCLSVSHAEIREALLRGWRVWGLSSMGAIRAYEMRHMGARGYGRVYQLFFEHEEFRDDEVALTHEPQPPFRPLTEPLVHLRRWLAELVGMNILSRRHEREVCAELMSLWFGERTLACARALVVARAPEHAAAVDLTIADFARFHVKCQDLIEFLGGRAWESGELQVGTACRKRAGDEIAECGFRIAD